MNITLMGEMRNSLGGVLQLKLPFAVDILYLASNNDLLMKNVGTNVGHIKNQTTASVCTEANKKRIKEIWIAAFARASKAKTRIFSLRFLFRFITFIPKLSTFPRQITEAPQILLLKKLLQNPESKRGGR